MGDKSSTYCFHGLHVVEYLNFSYKFRKALSLITLNSINSFIDRFFGGLSTYLNLKKFVSNTHFDIIHYSNWKGYGFFNFNRNSILRISSFESLWDNNPFKITLDKKLCIWLEENSIKKFNHLIGPGYYLNTLIQEKLNVSIKHINTPNPNWNIIIRPISKKFKIVTYIGTISYVKGANLLFEIINNYLSSYDDTIFVLVGKNGKILNSNSSYYINDIKNKYHKRFYHFNHFEKSKIKKLLNATDVFLIPSLIDNFPNTALEALNFGLPTIVSHTASLNSLIKDGENGFILNNNMYSLWIQKIRYILFEMTNDELFTLKKNINNSLFKHRSSIAVNSLIQFYYTVISEL